MKGDDYSGLVFWGKNGFSFSKNESELISENIRRILLTSKGERVGNPEFGSNLKRFLFMPQVFIDNVIDEIKYSVEKFEPRVTVVECSLEKAGQDDVVNINLSVRIKSSGETDNVVVGVKV